MSGPHDPQDSDDSTKQWAPSPPPSSGAEQGPAPTQAFGTPQQGQAPGQSWAQQGPGQTPQPGQQWGQPQQGQPQQGQWGQQPGQQWGATGANQWNAGAPQTKSKTGLIVGLAVAALVLIGAIIGAVLLLGGTDTLDPEAAQAGVEKVLTESYGATDVSDVRCPDGEEVKAGNSFECTLTVDGQFRTVTLTFTDDEGTYEVSRPN
ncbi:DUF4333 domain-containing protein [Rhodococcus rhodochrous]|uniref:DUF4333 domain-containing protein n=1 Tax=Rhodococcus rhodochrous KG-21 TaxID=1441923 RepID=A0A0M9WLB9_RHORH|nr:DUF4333 domain-containing protein [Rhodococcus rhodochrous]KOS53223.1 hypothetical protein Z051_26760 [Rhodococcus rhodochrous KG-21]